MCVPSTTSTRFKKFLVVFLSDPVGCILGWVIQLVLYPLCWLGIQLNRLRKRHTTYSPSTIKKPDSDYGIRWEIRQAIRDQDAGGLAAIFSIYVWCAITIGLSVILLVHYASFPVTLPITIIGVPIFLAWCCGLIKDSYHWRIGLLCMITGILGGLAAIRWPQNLSEDHWTCVIILILGGAALVWQSWKKPHSSPLEEQE